MRVILVAFLAVVIIGVGAGFGLSELNPRAGVEAPSVRLSD
ncbi:hypothetical protein [Pikeienuella piscinae]|nr:hypothetical protein [Pikeienuella piscinae]